MTKAYSVKIEDNYPDANLEEILREEMFKGAVRCMNAWADNISQGQGAEGSHGGPYVNTGEARDSITMIPEKPDADNYKVGSDKIQVAIAEFGRAPGSKPSKGAIAYWVKEKGIMNPDDEYFWLVVETIRKNIAKNGLEAFAPGRLAFQETIKDLDDNIKKRLDLEVESR